jgi:hypothetical protein
MLKLGRITVQGQPGQIVHKTSSHPYQYLVVHTSNSKLHRRLISGELYFQASQGKKKKFVRPISMEKSWMWWCAPVMPAIAGSVK